MLNKEMNCSCISSEIYPSFFKYQRKILQPLINQATVKQYQYPETIWNNKDEFKVILIVDNKKQTTKITSKRILKNPTKTTKIFFLIIKINK